MFFGLSPENAMLSDVNAELMAVYLEVQRTPDAIVEKLKALSVDAETYHRVRALSPSTTLDAAVRFLYLNRTAFGGMYRLNRNGQFNVPFGGGDRTPAPLWESNLLLSASRALRGATILTADFESVLAVARDGDLVYCDPTYTVSHNNNGFIRYNERNFSWDDQQRLARACAAAAARGAFVIVSNADHPEVSSLYPSREEHTVQRWSGLCPSASKRQRRSELVLLLHPTATTPVAPTH